MYWLGEGCVVKKFGGEGILCLIDCGGVVVYGVIVYERYGWRLLFVFNC